MTALFNNANILTAFLAGLLSFFSPCTLPLVPLFLGHLTGLTTTELVQAKPTARARLLRNALTFVLGFSLVFILIFGLPVGLLGQALQTHRETMLRIGGLLLVLLGLNYLGLIRIGLLQREWRPHLRAERQGHPLTSLLIGATFALGWTPCIGAILGAILTLAAIGSDPFGALTLLLAYSLGLGLPFLVVAAGFSQLLPALRRLNPYLPTLNRLSGLLIITIGAFMLVGAYQAFFASLIRLFPWTPPL